jgi:ribosome-binding protein aMBF1 (putative translation factor)
MGECPKCGLRLGQWSIKMNIDNSYIAVCLDCEGMRGEPICPQQGDTFEDIAKRAIESFVERNCG